MSQQLNYFILFWILGFTVSYGQTTNTYKHPNGNIKSEITYNKDNVLTKYVEWDEFGNLLSVDNFDTKYADYPTRDFSGIKWGNIQKGVSIYKFNAKDTAVVVTDSSFVTLHYQCFLSSGKMIDNSFARGCPMQTRLHVMIRGFCIGVCQMKPGESALIKIEPAMGFGDEVMGNVPAKSTLIYLVQLMSSD